MFEKMKLKKKIKLLEREVSMGDSQAMYELAMIYLDGTVIKKDEEKAIKLLKQAANEGNLQAKTYLVSNKIMNSAIIGAKAVSDIIQTIHN